MPLAIEYVNGMTTIVRNAGSATVKSSKSISLICAIISTPTITSAGAAASTGTASYSGVKNIAMRNSTPVTTFADVQRMVSGRAGDALVFVMMRNGAEVTLTATPELMETTDALGNQVSYGAIGVINNEEYGQPRLITYSPGEAVVQAVSETGHIVVRTGQFLQRFVVGREDRCQLGGPVRIADMAGKAARLGFDWLVQLVALLSVGIGILNLLPIPPLDGGHLAFYAYEAAFRRPVSERMMEAVYRTGMFLVLAFMAFVFWNDLFGC